MDTSHIPHLRDYAVEYEQVDRLLVNPTVHGLLDEFADDTADWDDTVEFDIKFDIEGRTMAYWPEDGKEMVVVKKDYGICWNCRECNSHIHLPFKAKPTVVKTVIRR